MFNSFIAIQYKSKFVMLITAAAPASYYCKLFAVIKYLAGSFSNICL